MSHRSRASFLGIAAVILLSGCVADSVAPLPQPPEISVRPTTTSIPDFSGTSLPPVGGSTTLAPIAMKGGNASLRGRVTGGGITPGGATVRVERFVGDRTVTADVIAGEDGTYNIGDLRGGRYRIRAFRPPDGAMPQAQVIFLAAGEQRSLDLLLEQFSGGSNVTAAIAPDPPELGEIANVVVQIAGKGVDAGGVARSIPSPNVPVTLLSAGGRAIITSPQMVTDASGKAQWTVRCVALENQQLTVSLPDGAQVPLNVAGCRLPPTTTTIEGAGLQPVG